MAYAKSVQQLIRAFSHLPGVGSRTAERFVFHLLRQGKKDVGELTVALKELMEHIQSCERCWTFADTNPCATCADITREQNIVCVVAQPQDIEVIERMGSYHGVYHILRGTIRPDDEDGSKRLKLKELLARLRKNDVREIILALNPDIQGETTMMYLTKKIKEISPTTIVSRLARGLPMGSDLQYADEITLGSAFTNRTKT